MALTESDRAGRIAGFRTAADLMESHPNIAAPMVIGGGEIRWHLYEWDCPDGIPKTVAAIRRAVGGKWTKREAATSGGDAEMFFEREGYAISTARAAVCIRRVVGTETITKPAVSLPERTEEREIVEWDCEPVLAAEATS